MQHIFRSLWLCVAFQSITAISHSQVEGFDVSKKVEGFIAQLSIRILFVKTTGPVALDCCSSIIRTSLYSSKIYPLSLYLLSPGFTCLEKQIAVLTPGCE